MKTKQLEAMVRKLSENSAKVVAQQQKEKEAAPMTKNEFAEKVAAPCKHRVPNDILEFEYDSCQRTDAACRDVICPLINPRLSVAALPNQKETHEEEG